MCEDIGITISDISHIKGSHNDYNAGYFLEIILFSDKNMDLTDFLARISILLQNDPFSDDGVFVKIVELSLERWGLPYALCGNILIPKGAKELDGALVSDVADWLAGCPKSHNLYISALKQYADNENPVEIADNLRRSFEVFLQEFLVNDKNLDNNKSVVGQYLKEQGVSDDARNLFTTLMHYYKLDNDKTAKHHAETNKSAVEFLLYQAGVFMRLLLVLRKNEIQT